MSRLQDRVVIVTGAARGLGRDYARYFARDGANVVLADVKGTESAAEEASAEGPRCIGVEADVTDRASTDAMVAAARDAFGRLDVLVNNAGLWRGLNEAGLLECPDEIWDAAWAVNVTGSLRCYQSAVPLMREGGFGRVINISSMAARSGGNPYGLTKNAVEHMTRGMAREVGEDGITVNCIAPGISAFEAAQSQLTNADQVVAGNAIKRMGTGELGDRRDLPRRRRRRGALSGSAAGTGDRGHRREVLLRRCPERASATAGSLDPTRHHRVVLGLTDDRVLVGEVEGLRRQLAVLEEVGGPLVVLAGGRGGAEPGGERDLDAWLETAVAPDRDRHLGGHGEQLLGTGEGRQVDVGTGLGVGPATGDGHFE
jgi:NAD(P)-dependent dehydrogenase (short-subunit alcohol dehydrogenase family)